MHQSGFSDEVLVLRSELIRRRLACPKLGTAIERDHLCSELPNQSLARSSSLRRFRDGAETGGALGPSLDPGCRRVNRPGGEVFRSLKDRGLPGVVQLVISDAHEGIRAALKRHLQGVAWQRCCVHYKQR